MKLLVRRTSGAGMSTVYKGSRYTIESASHNSGKDKLTGIPDCDRNQHFADRGLASLHRFGHPSCGSIYLTSLNTSRRHPRMWGARLGEREQIMLSSKQSLVLMALASAAIHAILRVAMPDEPYVGSLLLANTLGIIGCVILIEFLEYSRACLDAARRWIMSFQMTVIVLVGVRRQLRQTLRKAENIDVFDDLCPCGSRKKLKNCHCRFN
jgi:hypothetical protein